MYAGYLYVYYLYADNTFLTPPRNLLESEISIEQFWDEISNAELLEFDWEQFNEELLADQHEIRENFSEQPTQGLHNTSNIIIPVLHKLIDFQ